MLLDIVKSKFFASLVVVVLVMVLVFLGKELKSRYEIRKEIQNLNTQITELSGKNQETEALIQYLKTIEYQERQARSLLNLQKPGEFAVALPFQEKTTSTPAGAAHGAQSNLLKWWNYFFNHGSK